QIERAIPGHGRSIQRFPSAGLPSRAFPFSSTRIGKTPGSGNVAKLGLVCVIPAKGEIIIPPVSVCHHVSTIGHFFAPILSLYQCQASSLIGSPTEPKTSKDERSCFLTCSRP